MLKFAVIGVGRMGKRHVFNLAHSFLSGVKLVAVCDVDSSALDWCAKHAKRATRYQDYRQMLNSEKLDGVIVATPHYSHEEIAVACVEAGVNTLVEKPIAVTTAAAKRMAACAVAHPSIKTGVSFNQRSNAMYARAKRMIGNGELGKITRVNFTITDWYRAQAYFNQGGWRASYVGEGGGCLINQCVHQLDVMQWIVGMPKAVKADCNMVDRNIGVENDVAAIFDGDGFRISFSASTHELKGTNRLEIACDKGKIVIGRLFMKVYRHKSENEVNAHTTHGYGFAPSSVRVYGYGFFRLLADLIKGQQLRSLRAFARCVGGRGETLATFEQGLNAVELINGTYLASWTGQKVALPLVDAEYETALEQKRQEELNRRK